MLPFSLREAAETAGREADDIQYLGALPHGFGDATQAWAKGWYNDGVAAKGAPTMTHYDRRDLGVSPAVGYRERSAPAGTTSRPSCPRIRRTGAA